MERRSLHEKDEEKISISSTFLFSICRDEKREIKYIYYVTKKFI